MSIKDDLKKTKWKSIAAAETSYLELSHALQKLARMHSEQQEYDEAKAVGLLSSVCSMMISSSNSINEPYRPYWIMDGKSSANLKYFDNEETLEYFRDIFPLVKKYPLLRARIGDVLWLLGSPKDINHALGAIEGYLVLPIDGSSWYGNHDQCWQRAVTFTKRLGKGGAKHLPKLENAIYKAFLHVSKSDRKFAQKLSDLLLVESFAKNDAEKIAKIIEKHAKQFLKEKEFNWASEAYRQTSTWFAIAGKDEESLKAEVAIGDSLAAEAEYKRDNEPSGVLVCGELFDRALQLYRQIPSDKRGKLRVESKIKKVSQAKEKANSKATGFMHAHEIETIDYRELHKLAKQIVQAENPVHCLRKLACMDSGFDIDSFEEEIQQRKPSIFRSLFSSVQMTDTGQIAAKAPSIGLDPIDPESEDYKNWMSFELQKRYEILIKLQVDGLIIPALWEMHQTKLLTERFFVNLAYWSPSIPEGRERLVGKALYSGYEMDFATAIHLLSPQMENIVRVHLKQKGVNTRHTDRFGIDTEKGLSALASEDVPEFEATFGKNIAAEIRMLFCEGAGPNLRNNVAHGLMDDYSSQSPNAVYAWWFFLKILFSSFQRGNDDVEE